ncbi:MAG: hypothetical protein CMH98_18130 [Oceanospirillaceae bacterium]|nr:hypothetical protein [Oceanospirillaceae bacterium]|tara:strand:+ start:2104 stop:2583 length:480 start_codon:yes stop_codon:yes gene_type:complete
MKIAFLLVILIPSACFAREKAERVVVDKSERLMILYSTDKELARFSISLGGSPEGHKTQEGDQKTPEGVYLLDYKKEDSAFYRAMHISYPNPQDVRQAAARKVSPGGMIMVHGQKNGLGWLAPLTQLFDWTDGCIAVTNSEMDTFMSLVDAGTPVEIRW